MNRHSENSTGRAQAKCDSRGSISQHTGTLTRLIDARSANRRYHWLQLSQQSLDLEPVRRCWSSFFGRLLNTDRPPPPPPPFFSFPNATLPSFSKSYFESESDEERRASQARRNERKKIIEPSRPIEVPRCKSGRRVHHTNDWVLKVEGSQRTVETTGTTSTTRTSGCGLSHPEGRRQRRAGKAA